MDHSLIMDLLHVLIWAAVLGFFLKKLADFRVTATEYMEMGSPRIRQAIRFSRVLGWSCIASFFAMVAPHFVHQSTIGLDIIALGFAITTLRFFYANKEDIQFAFRRIVGRNMPIPVAKMMMEKPMENVRIGQFWWYLNGENTILWDREGLEMHGLDIGAAELKDDGVYALPYEEWAKTVDGEDELRRAQSIAADSFASGEPMEVITRHRDGKGIFHVVSKGLVKAVGDGRLMAHGIVVRIDGSDHEDTINQMTLLAGKMRSYEMKRHRIFNQIHEKE